MCGLQGCEDDAYPSVDTTVLALYIDQRIVGVFTELAIITEESACAYLPVVK